MRTRSQWRDKTPFTDIHFWSNVAHLVAKGQKQVHLRDECPDAPANQIDIPAHVPLYLARNSDMGAHVAFIEANGLPAVVAAAASRQALRQSVTFSLVYAQFVPSTWYRAFRSCFGYDYGSADYQPPSLPPSPMRAEGENGTLLVLVAPAGRALGGGALGGGAPGGGEPIATGSQPEPNRDVTGDTGPAMPETRETGDRNGAATLKLLTGFRPVARGVTASHKIQKKRMKTTKRMEPTKKMKPIRRVKMTKTTEKRRTDPEQGQEGAEMKPMTSPLMEKIISDIATKHGFDLDASDSYLRLELRSGFMPLVIEKTGPKLVSVAHYYLLNGDLVADPDVVFLQTADGWAPIEVTMPLGGYSRCAQLSADDAGIERLDRRRQADLASFGNDWGRNIRDQGWIVYGVPVAGSTGESNPSEANSAEPTVATCDDGH